MKLKVHIIICLLVLGCSPKTTNDKVDLILPSDAIDAIKEIEQNTNEAEIVSKTLRAKGLVENISSDKIRIKGLQEIALKLYGIGDYKGYKRLSENALDEAVRTSDTSNMARALRFIGFYHKKFGNPDSTIFYFDKALNLYSKIQDTLQIGKMFTSISFVKEGLKDYVGAEDDAIEAIKELNRFPPNPTNPFNELGEAYEALAGALNGLDNSQESIRYFKKALEYYELNHKNVPLIKNNIAVGYRKLGEYDEALTIWSEALETAREQKFKETKLAIIIDNYAHGRLMVGDTRSVERDLKKALFLRTLDSDYPGEIMNRIHLADYYIYISDIESAKKQLSISIERAGEVKDYGDILTAIKKLSDIEQGQKAKFYADKYIRISDSLQEVERNFRNKYARIEFETDQVIAEKEQVSKEKSWIITASSIIVFAGFLLFVIKNQRSRNKELLLEQQQQEANEEVYKLMLVQQDKINESRLKEQTRISEELHDGVLSKLFGTRLNLDTLNTESSTEAVRQREQYLNELKNIEQEIRQVSHELSNGHIEEAHFESFLKDFINDLSVSGDCSYQIHMDSDIDWELFDAKSKIHIYRILQEAIQNIRKYSSAQNASIDFNSDGKNISLRIKDDGNGFKVSKRHEGIGLKNMRSRASKLNGQIEINSRPNQGTVILLNFPLC